MLYPLSYEGGSFDAVGHPSRAGPGWFRPLIRQVTEGALMRASRGYRTSG